MTDQPQSRNDRPKGSALPESANPRDEPPEIQRASDTSDTEEPKAGAEPRTEDKPQVEVRDEIPPPSPAAASRASVARVADSGRLGPAGEEIRDVTPRDRKRINRRELLKLAPVAIFGAFAIPKLQQPLLNTGLHFSDWTAGKLFGRHRLEPEYSNSEVAPFDKFPYNFYDVVDPGVDLASWTLTVEGLVQAPGRLHAAADSGAAQGHAEHAPRLRRRLGRGRQLRRRARLGLSALGRRRSHRALSRSRVRRRILRVDRHGDHPASANDLLLRDVRPATRPRPRRAAAACGCPPSSATSRPNISTPFA